MEMITPKEVFLAYLDAYRERQHLVRRRGRLFREREHEVHRGRPVGETITPEEFAATPEGAGWVTAEGEIILVRRTLVCPEDDRSHAESIAHLLPEPGEESIAEVTGRNKLVRMIWRPQEFDIGMNHVPEDGPQLAMLRHLHFMTRGTHRFTWSIRIPGHNRYDYGHDWESFEEGRKAA